MKINIELIIGKEIKKIEIDKGESVLGLINSCEELKNSSFLLAEINGKYERLDVQIEKECQIKLFDFSNQAANITYQNTLVVIFLYAVKNILGKTKVNVQNTLSGGVFIVLKGYKSIEKELLNKIKDEMKEIVGKNIPISIHDIWGAKGKEVLEKEKIEFVKEYMEEATEDNPLRYCQINDFKEVVYSQTLPFTGMAKKFDIIEYEEGLVLRGPEDEGDFQMKPFEEEKNIYKAFVQEQKWGEMLEIENIEELNRSIKDGSIKEKILLAEAFHQQRIIEIVEEILSANKRIIFISGPSSSGKTTTAKRLILQLKVNGHKPIYIGTDDYFVEREEMPKDKNGEYDFDKGIETVDVKLFNEHMKSLLSGEEVDLPVYDFKEGKKTFGKRKVQLKEEELIVIEGIHALNKALSSRIAEEEKYKIYISPLTQINIDDHNRVSTRDSRLLRRMIRDYYHRHYSPQNTIKIWPKVREGEERNVFPGNKEADTVFNTALIYELGVLRKYVEPMLLEVQEGEEAYAEAQRLLEFIKKVNVIEVEKAIANVSLIREFIGGGVFS